jgi:hypothetical protein
MFTAFWFDFSILLLAAIFGSIAIIPYSLRLLKESKKSTRLKMPRMVLILLSVIQNGILFSIAIAIGLILSHQIGHGAPLIEAISAGSGLNQALAINLIIASILGILGGSFLLIVDLLFLPYFPKKLLDTVLKTTYWENLTASFYGGINEEIFMRLCGLSVIAWLLLRILPMVAGTSTVSVFWIANGIMAVLFALGHLPALKSTLGKLSRVMVFRTILLNTPIGLICGWIFWQYGIEAAIVAHFAADIVYHVGGTRVLRSKCKQS